MTGSEPEFEDDEDAEEDAEADSSRDPESDPDNSDGDGDEADHGGAEPPAPTDESEFESPSERWGVGSRVLALSALLGCAFVVWWQLAFHSRWVTEFLDSNTLDSPEQRTGLVIGFVLGLLLGGA